jgi:hypothetical protein
VALGHGVAQPGARVHHREDQLVGGEAVGRPPGDQAQQVGLAALAVAEHQQVLVAVEQERP